MTDQQPAANSNPPRRSNAERSQTTRAKIINAAIYCLRHCGYEGTSINLVAEKAGVSKGATQHHYTTKTELMLGVAEYCLQAQTDYRIQAVRGIQGSTNVDWFAAIAESSWDLAQQSYYIALIEIMMATRNDKVLKKRFAPLSDRIEELQRMATERFAQQLGVQPNKQLAGMVQMHNTMVRGLAIGMMYTQNKDGLRAGFDTLKECEQTIVARVSGGHHAASTKNKT